MDDSHASASHPEYDFSARFYDHVIPYKDRQSDVAFYVERAVRSGSPVLELGCGTGRVLLPTARAGIEVTGVDLSPAMLAVCAENLSAEPEEVRARVRLIESDICDFNLGKTFSLITMPFRPFQHLITVEDQLDCLRTVRQHLPPGGWLIFDLFNPSLHFLTDDSRLGEWGDEPEFVTPQGERVTRKFRVVRRDWLHQAQETEMIYYVTRKDGTTAREVDRFPMRYFFRYEVEHLLVRAGFSVEEILGDFDGTPYGTKYPGELIFVARRLG